ncbi:magnesium chelatase domain-containing protein [Bifidobacterium simiarum]|uniref:magnesium chelatase domain-containing protein n=1 Tax=Bifidobacterium simiarum TaxID=2045441 RepID=UPI001BDD55E8|nr:magnesium chelatase domain-containing protein [Bifidobacterium simiarum]MBT1167258.1 hypothetical protein [Bifidobacterium simiarum]
MYQVATANAVSNGHIIEAQAYLTPGLPYFSVIGVADASLSDLRWTIRAAVESAGLTWPACRVTVNLSPAAAPKNDADVAAAVATAVAAAIQGRPDRYAGTLIAGRLTPDGRIESDPGDWDRVAVAARRNIRHAIAAADVPNPDGMTIHTAATLADILATDPTADEPATIEFHEGDRIQTQYGPVIRIVRVTPKTIRYAIHETSPLTGRPVTITRRRVRRHVERIRYGRTVTVDTFTDGAFTYSAEEATPRH